MGLFSKQKKKDKRQPKKADWAIRRSTLQMILESAKSTHPNEFSAALRAKDGLINELMLLPGTIAGNSHSIMQLHMLPIDFTVVGSVHSHPSPSSRPSGADIHFFSKFKSVHIIAAFPYTEETWQAYDHTGASIQMRVVD
jgi:proteasome lid subunit RPN8/RPN11